MVCGILSENILIIDRRNDSNREPHRSIIQPPAAGLHVRYAKVLTLKNVEFAFEARDLRPAIFAAEVAGLTLDNLRSQKTGAETLHLERIENLTVRNSPGLSNRSAAAIDLLKE
jgi:hypothetical protein